MCALWPPATMMLERASDGISRPLSLSRWSSCTCVAVELVAWVLESMAVTWLSCVCKACIVPAAVLPVPAPPPIRGTTETTGPWASTSCVEGASELGLAAVVAAAASVLPVASRVHCGSLGLEPLFARDPGAALGVLPPVAPALPALLLALPVLGRALCGVRYPPMWPWWLLPSAAVLRPDVAAPRLPDCILPSPAVKNVSSSSSSTSPLLAAAEAGAVVRAGVPALRDDWPLVPAVPARSEGLGRSAWSTTTPGGKSWRAPLPAQPMAAAPPMCRAPKATAPASTSWLLCGALRTYSSSVSGCPPVYTVPVQKAPDWPTRMRSWLTGRRPMQPGLLAGASPVPLVLPRP
mmetsp:Transcript_20426/g.51743  ORF Transcript_20426/g.51743 Transcript_20426/m.51743 type:complete len:350 (+) Transcript_20426:1142-2191(+)